MTMMASRLMGPHDLHAGSRHRYNTQASGNPGKPGQWGIGNYIHSPRRERCAYVAKKEADVDHASFYCCSLLRAPNCYSVPGCWCGVCTGSRETRHLNHALCHRSHTCNHHLGSQKEPRLQLVNRPHTNPATDKTSTSSHCISFCQSFHIKL